MEAPALSDGINQLLDKLIILDRKLTEVMEEGNDIPKPYIDKRKQICKELKELTKDQNIKGIFDEFRGYY